MDAFATSTACFDLDLWPPESNEVISEYSQSVSFIKICSRCSWDGIKISTTVWSQSIDIYFAPVGWWSITIRVSACLSVCLFAQIYRKSHVQISPNFLYMLPVAVAQYSSDGNAICYVLPVLWTTSCLHIMGTMGQSQSRRYVSSSSSGGGTGDKVWCVW